jgi:hypothetical protein
MEKMNKLIKGTLVATAIFFAQGLHAQQTMFNVPEADATDRKLLYFEESLDYNRELISNTTFTLGLGKGWEVGLNVRDMQLHTESNARVIQLEEDQPEESPKLLLNARKSFDLASCFYMSLGTRLGSTIASTQGHSLANFSYANTGICWGERSKGKFVAGGYYTNREYTGDTGEMSNYGFMGGVQVPVLLFNLSADYISGTSDISYLTVGAGINLPRKWELAGGVSIPSPGSNNKTLLTVQLSNR